MGFEALRRIQPIDGANGPIHRIALESFFDCRMANAAAMISARRFLHSANEDNYCNHRYGVRDSDHLRGVVTRRTRVNTTTVSTLRR